jgi:hypothetical protein
VGTVSVLERLGVVLGCGANAGGTLRGRGFRGDGDGESDDGDGDAGLLS